MSFDEKMFEKVHEWWMDLRGHKKHLSIQGQTLSNLDRRLHILVSALCEEPIVISPTSVFEPPLLNQLPLPPLIALQSTPFENEQIYLYRVFHFYVCRKLNRSVAAPWTKDASLAESMKARNEINLFIKTMSHHFNLPWELIDQPVESNFSVQDWKDPSSPIHLLGFIPFEKRSSALRGALKLDAKKDLLIPETELRAKTSSRPELLRPNENESAPLVHVFEKLLTADDYKSGKKHNDDSDFMQASQKAMDELSLRHVMRSEGSAASVLETEVSLGSQGEDLAVKDDRLPGSYLEYPEWFHQEGGYRQSWCRLFESTPKVFSSTGISVSERKKAKEIKKQLDTLLNQAVWKNRQKDGPELDLDAIVSHHAQRKASGSINQCIYMNRQRLERNVSIMLLMDLSLSTDSWVNNHRILDLLKKACRMIAYALSDFSDQVSMAGFRSRTRHHCEFIWLKNFKESWRIGEGRLHGVNPDGHTRIAPAIRHAFAKLLEQKARKKSLILMSDGCPSDLDHYEGAHGNHDVQRAIEELRASQIEIKALTVAKKHSFHLSSLFGQGRYLLIKNEEDVVKGVADILMEALTC